MNTENTSPSDQYKSQALSTAALARRHMLLKGLGKGSAALAVAMPITTLAAPTIVTGGNRLCTVSGVQSQVSSQVTEKVTCEMNARSYYAALINWPNYSVSPARSKFTVSGVEYTEKSKFSDIFGGGVNTKIYDIITAPSNSDEAVWVTALLNAVGKQHYFPYSAEEVVAFYKSTTEKRQAAFSFFSGLLSGTV